MKPARTGAVTAGGAGQEDWDRLAGRYDRQLGLERAALRAALDLAAPRSSDQLLDVATGTGAVLRELAVRHERPRRVVGVDLSAAMLARVPPLPVGWAVRRGDARRLAFEDESFQVVLAAYVLHVLAPEDLWLALVEIRRVLAPGGRLATVTPVVPPALPGRRMVLVLDGLARRAPRRFGGLRAYDPRPALPAAGLRPVRGRFVRRGYPSLCLLAHRG